MSLKNKLLVGTTLLSLLFNPLKATAEETIPKQPLAIERTLEEEISKPKIEINFNYKIESEHRKIDYLRSGTAFFPEIDYLGRYNPILTNEEYTQVENILKDVKYKTITSYQEFVTVYKNLSENQKYVLLSATGNLLSQFNYDMDLFDSELVSQEDFFYKFQDSLITGEENGIGVCKHIATHIEKTGEDLGIEEIDTVSGGASEDTGHLYTILKGENGINIIDYGTILMTNTKNTKKALESYQKYRGTAAFYHNFFDRGEFKGRIITEDGERLNKFIEYDGTLQNLKNKLIHNDSKEEVRDIKIALNLEKYLWSAELDLYEWFIKPGIIFGDISSSLKEMYLCNGGYRKKFSILDTININTELGLIAGLLHQDRQIDNDEIFGITTDLSIATNFEKGFNLTHRIAGKAISLGYDKILSYDYVIGTGTSCRIPIKNMRIEPYAVMQFNYLPKNMITNEYTQQLAEISSGIIFDIKSNKVEFSLDSYYLWGIGGQGFGGDIKFENKNFGINATGSAIWSNYEFFPTNIINIEAGLNFKLQRPRLKKKMEVEIRGGIERTNYDGEIDHQHLFGLEGTVKF